MDKPDETGFVCNGILSKNDRYDVRDDRVMRFIVDGRLRTRNELMFAENDNGVYTAHARNGAPYSISDMVVPIESVSTKETYSFREVSRVLDDKISDYLSLYLPEPYIDETTLISHRHILLSPLLSRLLDDILNGVLILPDITIPYSDTDVKEWLVDYEYLFRNRPYQKRG